MTGNAKDATDRVGHELPRHVTSAKSLRVLSQSSEDSPFQPFLSRLSAVCVKLVTCVVIGHFNCFCHLLTY